MRRRLVPAVALAATVLSGCLSPGEQTRTVPEETATSTSATVEPSPQDPAVAVPAPEPSDEREPTPASNGRPRAAALSIPALGLRGLVVVPYRGWTDDAPGTEIQNRGRAASPFGPRGGVGPGGVGNYQVTAHRTSATRAFEFLPDLRRGERVFVDVRQANRTIRYVYRIVGTRETSFRSEKSLREQRAAVPGRPGVEPTRAMITLSTCATQEDHAVGNYWADEFDNPEHRIDKIGVLLSRHRLR